MGGGSGVTKKGRGSLGWYQEVRDVGVDKVQSLCGRSGVTPRPGTECNTSCVRGL